MLHVNVGSILNRTNARAKIVDVIDTPLNRQPILLNV